MYIVHVTYVSSWMVMCFIWSRWVYTNVTMWPSIYLASRRGHTVEKCMQQRRRPYWSSPTKRRVSPLMVCEVLLPLIRIINDFCVEKADQSPPKRHSPPLATLCTYLVVQSMRWRMVFNLEPSVGGRFHLIFGVHFCVLYKRLRAYFWSQWPIRQLQYC